MPVERIPTEADFGHLRRLRATEPGRLPQALRDRRRRPLLADDGRLFIVAADHTARGALGVRGDPTAMADRYDLLERLAIALSRPGVDGVLGTPDVLEDLAALGLADDRVLLGSMNRGGLQGAVFEADDRFTAYDVATMVELGLDMAKVLIRVVENDPDTARTLESAARAVTAAARAGLPILLEPFLSRREGDRIVHDLSAAAVARSATIAAGLGAISAYTWLKLPVVPAMHRVMRATTLPTLLLGGDPVEDPDVVFATWAEALALPGVRGLVAGRTLLHPPDGDVAGAVDAAAALVHGPHRVADTCPGRS